MYSIHEPFAVLAVSRRQHHALMRAAWCVALVSIALLAGDVVAHGQGQSPQEGDYYRITRFPTPEGEVLEACGFQTMPDGRVAVCTRRGDIWMIADPDSDNPQPTTFSLFARGLHEPLSLAHREGWLYVTQRPEVSRIRDTDNDGKADEFETVSAGWGVSGDYHEYAFASKFDKQDNLWVVLCLTGSFSSEVPFRGWSVRVGADGAFIPTASGIRSPGGVGMNLEGDVFYTDNQGPWNGTCGLKHLKPATFQGHPGGFRWYDQARAILGDQADSLLGPKPEEPKSGSRMMVEAARVPQLEPTVVMFPYSKMGQSASGIACDTSGGKFGPFAGQLFVGDQTHSTLMRVYLEKVQGHYQGACFPFLAGFSSGNVGVEMTPWGDVFVGGTSRGWGSRGGKDFAVERVDWTGKVPMEIKEMQARPDGFELVFTHPVDPKVAADTARYSMQTFTYIYQADYGSPEVDPTKATVKAAAVSDDGLRVRLTIDGLQIGHVHELKLDGVVSVEGTPVLHPLAYYTLNYLPKP